MMPTQVQKKQNKKTKSISHDNLNYSGQMHTVIIKHFRVIWSTGLSVGHSWQHENIC